MKQPKAAALTPAEIDEFAHLHEQLGPMRKRHDQLQAKMIEAQPELSKRPDATAHVEGEQYTVDIGARTNETKVTGLDKLYKLLGLRKFIDFVTRCQVTQKALDASLPDGADRGPFLVTTQTGHRNFSITRKFKDAA
jgi:hypothetical protein